jgi:hypothetical protein
LEGLECEKKAAVHAKTDSGVHTREGSSVHARETNPLHTRKQIGWNDKTCSWSFRYEKQRNRPRDCAIYFAAGCCRHPVPNAFKMSLQSSSNWLFRMFKGILLRRAFHVVCPSGLLLFDPPKNGIQWLAFHELLINCWLLLCICLKVIMFAAD